MKDNESTIEAIKNLPAFGICGFSGSGKTTLIESLIPKLLSKNLKVAVIKHDVHGIDVDRSGKDSDRFFKAGADVYLQGEETMIRLHKSTSPDLMGLLKQIGSKYDLILVEGHKQTPISKVWLLSEGEEQPPDGIKEIKAVLQRDTERAEKFMDILDEWLLNF